MNLSVSPVSFSSGRMNSDEVNRMLRHHLTMPLDKKLPKNLEKRISPNFFQKVGNFFKRVFS